MKIVFLSVDDEWAGEMQRYLFERHPEWIIGSIISSCKIYKKTNLQAARFVLSKCGWFYVLNMLWAKVGCRLLRRGGVEIPSRLAKKHSVPVFYSSNINDEVSRQRLADWRPDLAISTNFNHFVGGRARNIPKIGTWNLHKSYLPHYRGMAPGLYALLNGEKWSGATLHIMDAKFDTGDIIRQVKVPIRDGDTVFDLNARVSREGGKMLADLLEKFDSDHLRPAAQPPGNWPTHTYPSRKEVREFRRKGLKFDRLAGWKRDNV